MPVGIEDTEEERKEGREGGGKKGGRIPFWLLRRQRSQQMTLDRILTM